MTPCGVLVERSMWEPLNNLDHDVLLRVFMQCAWSASMNTPAWDGSSTCRTNSESNVHVQPSIWRLVWAPPGFQLLVLSSSVPVRLMGIASKVNSTFRLLSRRWHTWRWTAQSQLVNDHFSVSWVSFVLNAFTSRSILTFDPSHNPVQQPDICDVPKCCAWSQCGKMLDDETFGQMFLKLLVVFSYPTPQNRRRVWTLNATAPGWYREGEKSARVISHRCHGILTRNIEALCSILCSVHGLVQKLHTHSCTRRLHVAPWSRYCDIQGCGNTLYWCRRNPRTFTSAGAHWFSVMHRLSTNLKLSSGGVAADVLLVSTSRTRMNGFAASPWFVQTHRVPVAFNPDLSRKRTGRSW